MSRFSKAEAEARGWQFVHDQEERREIVGGRIVIQPASYRAEKTFNGAMINEEAESTGLLLERIAAFEAFQESIKRDPRPVEVDEGTIARDGDGNPIRTVQLPSGEFITEAEYATARAGEDASPEVLEAIDARERRAADEENERTANPDVKSERLDVDETQSAIDGPGRQGTYLVREGESLEDVQARRDADSNETESSKLTNTPLEDAPEEGTTEGPTFEARQEQLNALHEATQDKVAEQGPAKSLSADAATEQRAAAVEAEQAVASDQREEAEKQAEETPEATPAAEAHADELGVDLTEVEGSGKDGKITKPDVEAAAEQADGGEPA